MTDVKGYEGLYKVDPITGKIFSCPRNGTKGVELAHQIGKMGYPYVVLSANNRRKTLKVHRLVAETLIPNPDPERLKYVNHKDGNKLNFLPSNLEWCTMQQNIQHSWAAGLSKSKYGELNHNSKLTDLERIEIVKRYANGETQLNLSREYGISQTNITLLVKAYLCQHFKTITHTPQ